MIDIRYPNINAKTEAEQQIKSYLIQLADQLKWALNNIDAPNNTEVVSPTPRSLISSSHTPSSAEATDFVVEKGTNGIWSYRKWNSGIAECWCKRNINVDISAAWGSALFHGVASAISYPFAFAEAPICQTTCEYGSDVAALLITSYGSSTNVATPALMLCRPDAKTVNCNILYHVHGRWK